MKKGILMIGFVCLLGITMGYSRLAHAEERNEPSIQIYDGENLFTISLGDIRKYHGSCDPCGVYAIKAVQLAVSKLWDEIPRREDFRIYTSHPCPTSRDAFEFITRGKERRDFLFVKPEELLAISSGLTGSRVRYKFIIIRKSTSDALLIKQKPKEKIASASFLKMMEKRESLSAKEQEKFYKTREFKQGMEEFQARLGGLPAEKIFDFKVVRASSE